MQLLAIRDDEDADRCNTMPAELTATILGTQCSSLLALCITAQDVGSAGDEFAALVVLKRLECLQV